MSLKSIAVLAVLAGTLPTTPAIKPAVEVPVIKSAGDVGTTDRLAVSAGKYARKSSEAAGAAWGLAIAAHGEDSVYEALRGVVRAREAALKAETAARGAEKDIARAAVRARAEGCEQTTLYAEYSRQKAKQAQVFSVQAMGDLKSASRSFTLTSVRKYTAKAIDELLDAIAAADTAAFYADNTVRGALRDGGCL